MISGIFCSRLRRMKRSSENYFVWVSLIDNSCGMHYVDIFRFFFEVYCFF
jgi:hypothetical protein